MFYLFSLGYREREKREVNLVRDISLIIKQRSKTNITIISPAWMLRNEQGLDVDSLVDLENTYWQARTWWRKIKEDSDLSAIDKSHKNIKQFKEPEVGRNEILDFPSVYLFALRFIEHGQILFGSYSLLDFTGNIS